MYEIFLLIDTKQLWNTKFLHQWKLVFLLSPIIWSCYVITLFFEVNQVCFSSYILKVNCEEESNVELIFLIRQVIYICRYLIQICHLKWNFKCFLEPIEPIIILNNNEFGNSKMEIYLSFEMSNWWTYYPDLEFFIQKVHRGVISLSIKTEKLKFLILQLENKEDN